MNAPADKNIYYGDEIYFEKKKTFKLGICLSDLEFFRHPYNHTNIQYIIHYDNDYEPLLLPLMRALFLLYRCVSASGFIFYPLQKEWNHQFSLLVVRLPLQ